jgi:hypothetical protein
MQREGKELSQFVGGEGMRPDIIIEEHPENSLMRL